MAIATIRARSWRSGSSSTRIASRFAVFAAFASAAMSAARVTIRVSGATPTAARGAISGAATMTMSSVGGIRILTLSTSTPNSSSLNRARSFSRSQPWTTSSSSSIGSFTSRRSSTSLREILRRASWSGSLNGCLILMRGTIGFASIRPVSEPY